MEDGSDGLSSETSNLEAIKNGDVMAKLSEAVVPECDESKPESPVKINGNPNANENTLEEECDSSDCDALVIDESVISYRTKRNESRSKCGGFKGFKKTTAGDSFIHSNPYFSESIFDLLEKSQEKKQENSTEKTCSDKKTNCKNNLKSSDKKLKSNPKLREYAQYLGLQPTVQFKCSKCSRAGFQSLQSLNEHLIQCDDSAPANNLMNNSVSNAPSTNIRVTRKVFLCSACGTYYENWNLFLHMREVHKRYICLYCLGMFSHPDKLSLHIISKHNCVPSHINTIEEFYNIHKEPCFLMCCECQKGFTERDNFFDHSCIDNSSHAGKVPNNKQMKSTKQKNIEHVTADSIDNETTQITEETQHFNTKNLVTENNELDTNDENFITETNEEMKMEIEQNVNDVSEINENLAQLDSKNNLSNLTDTVLDDNRKSVETLICDKETDDINQLSNLSEEGARKQTESNSDEEIIHQDDSLSQGQANSDDLNDSLDMSTTEEPEMETAQESNPVQIKENQSDVEIETRKVPKVTLKLPKSFDYVKNDEDLHFESDDSENLTMEVDQIENESENVPTQDNETITQTTENQLQVAGPDVPIIELELEQPLDKFDIRILIQKCLRTTISTCIYCNHARRISVNGKQLGLHAIAEHRFSAVVNSITAEELIPESFVGRIKDGLTELESVYFNLETNLPEEAITFSHIFECFQCRYSTTIHKELYLHNRKMHAKSILLCIMCKSNFYSYSELICHLCPGIYELEKDVQFRCCMCVSDDLPSAFRLMVHLRKRHHACDVCLELCHNQSKLSNHVWKHKLHHLCYRCGIAYRNKPDITKHLYWKHGTESVTCKKCLQKKWPHVYHFCIPPLSFTCEDCNLSFSRAVSLMVHKRFHTDEKRHTCNEEGCDEKFVSKKLLLKHEFKHREPPEEMIKVEPVKTEEIENPQPSCSDSQNLPDENVPPPENEEKVEKPKPKVDVYDLPELNLSESDSSDSEDEKALKNNDTESNGKSDCQDGEKNKTDLVEVEKPPPVMETIWDDFRNYQANKEKEEQKPKEDEYAPILEVIMSDHDYCVTNSEEKEDTVPVKTEETESARMSVDHDYCFGQKGDSKEKSPKKKSSSSGSSTDSDSSSCTCGSNCSCSSSSGSSSSSSDSSESDSSSSEGRRRQQARRERRKQKLKTKNKENETVDVVATDNQPVIPLDVPVQESDLETTESDTDEDFYDKQPQKLANKLLAEKKNQLLQMAAIGPYINGSIMDGSRPPTPSLPEEVKPKKKSKNKKRKKKNKSSKYQFENINIDIPQTYQTMTPLTLTIPKNSPASTPLFHSPNSNPMTTTSAAHMMENDSTLRASKRRRVPNKFYGYSSDEEHEKIPQPPVLKWRKVDLPSPRSPLTVPPLTIKTMPPQPPAVDPMMGKGTTTSGESRIQQARIHQRMRPLVIPKVKPPMPDQESASDSNDSSSDDDQPPSAPPVKEQPALYCYCRCPYDEVSEMIGCDATDCAIEWFHFECVGIMVPPRGQWFCPDCRKKKQQRREALQNQV